MEQQLQMYEPDLRIPYWDWANDHTLPGWLILPSGGLHGRDALPPLAPRLPPRLKSRVT
jgi:hypothetical protein